MKLSLYHLSQLYQDTLNDLCEQSDLESEHAIQVLSSIEDDMKNKSLNIAAYIKNLKIEKDILKNYEQEMKQKRKSIEKKIDIMEDYIKTFFSQHNIKKVSNAEIKISLRNSPPSVKIEDLNKLPDIYKKVEYIPIKEGIKKTLIEGGEVPGAILIKDKTTIFIK